LTKKKLTSLIKKSNRSKKEKLVKFISTVELTANSFLLRTRLVRTKGIANQLIKHGNVYVNYNKILSPSSDIKPGDTISIYINSKKQKYHRFNDPLYTNRLLHGLYRKNTGRQSLIACEKQPLFTKTSLNNISKIQNATILSDKTIIPDIMPFYAKDRIKIINESHPNLNSLNISNWKLSFLSNTIPGSFIQQNKYVDHIHNSLT
jgi:ribosomal protein S4